MRSIILIGSLLIAGSSWAAAEEGASEGDDVKPYPLTTCLVSKEDLGSMGEPMVLVHEGQEIKFCCEGCIDDFKAEPDKYLAALHDTAGDEHGRKAGEHGEGHGMDHDEHGEQEPEAGHGHH